MKRNDGNISKRCRRKNFLKSTFVLVYFQFPTTFCQAGKQNSSISFHPKREEENMLKAGFCKLDGKLER